MTVIYLAPSSESVDTLRFTRIPAPRSVFIAERVLSCQFLHGTETHRPDDKRSLSEYLLHRESCKCPFKCLYQLPRHDLFDRLSEIWLKTPRCGG